MAKKRKKKKGPAPQISSKKLLRRYARKYKIRVVETHNLSHETLEDAKELVDEFAKKLKGTDKPFVVDQASSELTGVALWMEWKKSTYKPPTFPDVDRTRKNFGLPNEVWNDVQELASTLRLEITDILCPEPAFPLLFMAIRELRDELNRTGDTYGKTIFLVDKKKNKVSGFVDGVAI